MPWFVKVGAFPGNRSGVGARGWRIWRRGAVIHRQWGRVNVVNGAFFWAREPQRREDPFPTIEEARRFMAVRVGEQEHCGQDGAYDRLPEGVRIQAFRRLRPGPS